LQPFYDGVGVEITTV